MERICQPEESIVPRDMVKAVSSHEKSDPK